MRRILAFCLFAVLLLSACGGDPPGANDSRYMGPGNHMTGYHDNEVAEMDGYLVCAGEQEVVSTGPYKANGGITYNKAYEPQIDRLLESPNTSVEGAFGYVPYEGAGWLHGLMVQLLSITRDLNQGDFMMTPEGETFLVPKKCWVEAGNDVIMGERPFGVDPTSHNLEGEPALTANN
jgi:hypothetical protein